MTTPETKTRFLGCCQICGQEQKLHGGKLVHHGYKRPGWGEIVGDCYGVHAVPYEVSCELVKEYLGLVQRRLTEASSDLARWRAGKVTYFTEESRRFRGTSVLEHYALGVTEYWRFVRAVESRIHGMEQTVRLLTGEVKRLEKRIADWKPAATRTIEERMAEERAAKDVRAAERAAARKAKADKVAATQAKQAALAAKRQAIMDDFSVRFVALAAKPDSHERAREAMNLAYETKKTKYSFMYTRDLKCDEALITLGLARRDDRNWVRYLHPLG